MRRATDAVTDAKSGIMTQLTDADSVLNELYGHIIDDATLKGIQVPMTGPQVKSMVSLNTLGATNQIIAGSKEFAQLQALVNKLTQSGSLSPREVLSLKDLARDLGSKFKDPQIQGIAKQIAGDVNEALSAVVPGFKEVNQHLGGFREAVLDPLVEKRYSSIAAGKRENTLGKKLDGLLDNLRIDNENAIPANQKLDIIMEKLNDYEKANPGALEYLGIGSPQELAQKISDSSDVYNLVHKILGGGKVLGGSSTVKGNIVSQLSGYGTGKLFGTAQIAGATTRKLGHVFNLPAEKVGEMGYKLAGSNNQMAQNVGKYLMDAVQNNDTYKKNAALFIINQNPALKEILGFRENEE
jgi:hypothetical protein